VAIFFVTHAFEVLKKQEIGVVQFAEFASTSIGLWI
jgi:hypothetical protein